MASTTLQLASARYTSIGTTRQWLWSSSRPRVDDALVPRPIVNGEVAPQARFLVRVTFRSFLAFGIDDTNEISVSFSNAASGFDFTQQNLGPAFDITNGKGTFRVELSSGESIELPAKGTRGDPYTWSSGNGDFTLAEFRTLWNALGASGEVAALTLNDNEGVRIAGRLEIEGTGSSAAEVSYPVRIGGRLEIAGTGSSAVEITTDVRLAGRMEVEGTGASEVQVINPTRVGGRLQIEGTGGSGLEVTQPTKIAGRLEIAGTGSSALRIIAPVRIAGRLEIAGTGSSLLEILQPLGWDTEIRASSPRAAIITALEIEHPDASAPLRVVDAAEDRTIGGETYAALRFDAKLAFDDESRAPHAEISIDNVGRVGTEWLEETRGGAGATVRIMQALDVAPHVVEWEMTLDLLRTAVDSDRIAARLGFDPGLGRGAVAMRHDPATTPGIF